MPKEEKYNLQRLLEVRERTRETAIKFLAQCRQQLALQETELAARKDAVEKCRRTQRRAESEMLEKSRNGMKNSEILLHRRYLNDLREQEVELLAAVEEQKINVERAEQEVENALLALAEATKEVQVIEKHREKWQAEKRLESARREQKNNDEIGAILHERQKYE